MGYATYVGRVGALGVALGVGVAVASTPGWRGPTPTHHVGDRRRRAVNRLHGLVGRLVIHELGGLHGFLRGDRQITENPVLRSLQSQVS